MHVATIRGDRRRRRGMGLLSKLIITSALLSVSACMSTRGGSSALSARHAGSDVEPRLRDEIARWDGTPHVLGGTDARGLDCSAFVQRVYSDAFDVELPRSTGEQVRVGQRVRRGDLRAGDLVFFRPPTKSRHVGIYLSDGEFVHVSSSQGVSISELDLPYWERSYWTSRRVLAARPALDANPATSADAAPPPDRSATDRVGW